MRGPQRVLLFSSRGPRPTLYLRPALPPPHCIVLDSALRCAVRQRRSDRRDETTMQPHSCVHARDCLRDFQLYLTLKRAVALGVE